MMFEFDAPGYRLSWTVVGIATVMFAGLLCSSSARSGARAKNLCESASQAMRGLSAKVLDWSGNDGHVSAQGERWKARGAEAFKPGERRGRQYRRIDAGGTALARADRSGRCVMMLDYMTYAAFAVLVIVFLASAIPSCANTSAASCSRSGASPASRDRG